MLKQVAVFFFIFAFSAIFCGTLFAQKNRVVSPSDVDLYILAIKDHAAYEQKNKQAGLTEEDFFIILTKVESVVAGWRNNSSEDEMISVYNQTMRGAFLTKKEVKTISAKKKELVALDKELRAGKK
jgi:hypothetical protein